MHETSTPAEQPGDPQQPPPPQQPRRYASPQPLPSPEPPAPAVSAPLAPPLAPPLGATPVTSPVTSPGQSPAPQPAGAQFPGAQPPTIQPHTVQPHTVQPPAAPSYAAPSYAQPVAPVPPAAFPSPPQYVYPAAPTIPTPGAHQQQFSAPGYPPHGVAGPQSPAQPYGAPQYWASPYGVPRAPGPGEPYDGAAHPDDLSRPLYGATFGQAFTRFFKNYASFSGRASRSEYWWVGLMLGGGWIALGTIINVLEQISYASSSVSYETVDLVSGAIGFIIAIGLLGVFIPSLAITWRRLHDANLAGPFYFLVFMPIVGSFIVFVFTLLPSKVEGRRFARTY